MITSLFGDNIKPFGIFKVCKFMTYLERMLRNGHKFSMKSDKEEKLLILQRTRRFLQLSISTMEESNKRSITSMTNGTKKS
jgi:hypothetical protein